MQGPGFSFHVPLPTWASTAEPSSAEPPPPPVIDSGSVCLGEARADAPVGLGSLSSGIPLVAEEARQAVEEVAEVDFEESWKGGRPLKVAKLASAVSACHDAKCYFVPNSS